RVERRGVAREQAVQLYVEDEAGRGRPDPARDRARLRDRVEARVELDQLEALGVPGKAIASRHAGRVPLLHEAGVRPAGGSDEDAPGHRSDRSSAAPAEAVCSRDHRAQVAGDLLRAPCPARLDVADLAEWQVGAVET